MSRHPSPTRLTLITAFSMLASCSILERADERGRYGNLVFSIDAGAIATDFDNPVAVGAMLDIQVKDKQGGRANVTAASFRAEGTFEVVRFANNMVTVRALDGGSGTLEVTASGSEGEVDDVVDLSAEEAAEVTLSHRCNFLNLKTAQYGVGAAAKIDYSLRSRLSRTMLGYGYAPISVAPDGVIELAESQTEVGILRFTPATSAGRVTVSSTVDDESLDMRFVDPADIDGVQVNGLRSVSLFSSDPTRKVWPLFGGDRVCRAGVVPVVANTVGSNCSVDVTGDAGDEHYTLKITPHTAGPCEFTLAVPGSSASATFEFQISDE